MTEPTDRETRIMTYIDGAMSEEEMLAFEAEMEGDEALAEDVARLMRNDDLLREAFAGPVDQGVDDALLARMGLSDPSTAPSATPAPPANDNPPFWRGWKLPLGGALAASLAIVLAFSLQSPRDAGEVAFASAMDGLPSGQSAQLADGSEVSPILTFASADGRFCREFSLAAETGNGSGIACRDDGAWAVVALTDGSPDIASMDDIVLASGASESSLDAAYESLGASDPFDSAREQQLIDGDWQAD